MNIQGYAACFLLALLLVGAGPRRARAAVEFGLGKRFSLDTRPRSAESSSALGPLFELSTLRLAGRVLSAAGGGPIEGATLVAGDFAASSLADGSFVLAGVSPGRRYRLSAFAPGFGSDELQDLRVSSGHSATGLEFRLPAAAGDYALVPLWPPAGVPSSIMQGGTALRYFQVLEAAGRPGPPGVEVETGLDEGVFLSVASGRVTLRIPWSRIGDGGAGQRARVRIIRLGGRALNPPLDFEVEVRPRQYAVQWRSEGYSRVGLDFVAVEKAGGTSMRLEEPQGAGRFGRLEIARQIRSGTGAEARVGARAGVKVEQVSGTKTGVGAGAGTGAAGLLSALSEDRYRFAYAERRPIEALAQYVLATEGMVGDLSPALVNLLAFAEGRLEGESVLDQSYVYGGRGLDVLVGARARARASAGVFGRPVRAGIGARVDLGARGHGALIWAEYPQDGEVGLLLGATGRGRAARRAEAGLLAGTTGSALGAAAFGGAGAGARIGAQIELFLARDQLRRIRLTTRLRGRWGLDVGPGFLLGPAPDQAQGALFGQRVEASTILCIEGEAEALEALMAADPVGRALAERRVEGLEVDASSFQRLLNAISGEVQRLEQTGGPVSVRYTKEMSRIHFEEGGEIELRPHEGAALRVALAAGKRIEGAKVLLVQRGAWIDGALRPLESYADDAFTPDLQRTVAGVLQEIHDAMGAAAAAAFSSVVQEVSKGADTVVEIGRSSLRVAAGSTPDAVRSIGALSWSWWGASPASGAAQLPPAAYARRARIAALARRAARLDYGIGGFYQFTPPAQVLAEPAELSLAYTDAEVEGLDEHSLAVYTYDEETGTWLLIGGEVDAATNRVRADIPALGVFTLAPRIPDGDFELKAERGTLPADGRSTTALSSDTIWNNDGTPVAEGALFDVWATAGAIVAADEDLQREGLQLGAVGGKLHFTFEAGTLGLTARITARSVAGKALGRTRVELSDARAPAAPAAAAARWRDGEVVLHWQPNREADLAGYRIYYREGRPGPPYDGIAAPPGEPSPLAAGVDTTARVQGLDPGQRYFFVLSAFDIRGNESEFSAETTLLPEPSRSTGVFDGSGGADFAEFALFAEHFGARAGEDRFDAAFDLDGNGSIDAGDFFIFADHFDRQTQDKLLALAREELGLPAAPWLGQNYPNPFNASTLIRYALPRAGRVDLRVYDILGQTVRRLLSGRAAAGMHTIRWDGLNDAGRTVASGVYFYVLRVDQSTTVQRMLLLR